MARILIITNECYKSHSANGYCIENIVECLRTESNLTIDIVAFANDEDVYEIYENITIYYIKNRYVNSGRFWIMHP